MEQFNWSIWRNGIKAERSMKEDKPHAQQAQAQAQQAQAQAQQVQAQQVQAQQAQAQQVQAQQAQVQAQQAQAQQAQTIHNNELFRINNKREEANNKMSERYLIGQGQQNPFLADNDYLKDLDIQQHFLIPKNSNNKGFTI